MKCDVCGLEYGLSHNCSGISPLITPDELAPPPGLRFAPLHYFEEAFKIMTWDDAAVRRASKDNNSLVYGLAILAMGTAAPFGFLLLRDMGLGYTTPGRLLGVRYAMALAYSLAWIIAQIGLSHVLAKTFFEAKGSFVEIMRAYMLGQMFRWLIVIPLIGSMLVGLGGIAVLMMVFEEVDGIERMKAFGLAAAIGVTFWIASIWVATNGPRPM
jgi:hypothetical protein